NRAFVLGQLPRNGAPPAFGSYDEWERFAERFQRLGVAGEYTTLWWDIRPHPRFGTLEIRMPDQPTALAQTGAFVALLQALVAPAARRLGSFDLLAALDPERCEADLQLDAGDPRAAAADLVARSVP